LYPLGEVPATVLISIGKQMTYRYLVGQADISGGDWGNIFSTAISGEHLGAPFGLADVIYENMAWSVKSVKHNNPHRARVVRIISGRCSPDYSYGITNVRADIHRTGAAVLGIYNERVSLAKDKYEPLRISVIVRNINKLEFTLFELEIVRYSIQDYEWRLNKKNNLEGIDKISGTHKFTWQPHGAQLTIKYDIPASAQRFSVKRPPVLDFNETLSKIGFDDSWVTIL